MTMTTPTPDTREGLLQQARELLATEYDRIGHTESAEIVRRGGSDEVDLAAERAVLSALSAPSPTPETSSAVSDGAENTDRFWLILQEPGRVPEQKGPWRLGEQAKVLREFIKARPTAYISVLWFGACCEPYVDHGPQTLQILDGRSMGTGRKHNARVRAAHAAQHAAIAASQPSPAVDVEGLATELRNSLPALKASVFFHVATNVERALVALERLSSPSVSETSSDAMREALELIRDECRVPIDEYEKNGPTWTGKGGHEYADMSYVLEKMGELIAIVDSALVQSAAPREGETESAPIPMLLYCPNCGLQHVDAPVGEWDGKAWENPPHRSHLCQGCGTIWRPADVATTGVAAIETRGKADNWTAPIVTALPPKSPEVEGLVERVIEAARQMPRATPAPGGASTIHNFRIAACHVWDLDRALGALDAALRPAALASGAEGGER